MASWCYTINKNESGLSLKNLLESFGLAKAKYQKWMSMGAFQINDNQVDVNQILYQGDYLKIELPQEVIDYQPEFQKLTILYEDEYILIVDKPHNYIIYPETKIKTGTIANFIAGYYQSTQQSHLIRHLHRLDKETTGCLMYAKDMVTDAILSKMWQNGEIQKIYYAVVEHMPPASGRIDQKIGRDRHDSRKMRVSNTGKPAITDYRIIAKGVQNTTLIEAIPLTGRTHQIRLHMANMGCPLVGDTTYGGRPETRVLLHAFRLRFIHPITHQSHLIQAKIPQDMKRYFPNTKF